MLCGQNTCRSRKNPSDRALAAVPLLGRQPAGGQKARQRQQLAPSGARPPRARRRGRSWARRTPDPRSRRSPRISRDRGSEASSCNEPISRRAGQEIAGPTLCPSAIRKACKALVHRRMRLALGQRLVDDRAGRRQARQLGRAVHRLGRVRLAQFAAIVAELLGHLARHSTSTTLPDCQTGRALRDTPPGTKPACRPCAEVSKLTTQLRSRRGAGCRGRAAWSVQSRILYHARLSGRVRTGCASSVRSGWYPAQALRIKERHRSTGSRSPEPCAQSRRCA